MGADVKRLNTRSVRFRVTGLATLIVGVLLAVVAVTLVLVQQRTLTAALDDGLRSRADDLAAVIAESTPVALAGAGDDTAAQLVTPGGVVVVASTNLAGSSSIAPNPGDAEVISEVHVAGLDDTFRVMSRPVGSVDGPLVLHVATASDDVSDSVAILRTSLLTSIPVAIGLLAVAVWWLVGRALHPVEAIRHEVASIGEAHLNRRVPVPDTDDEVSRLADTMNTMLDRLEDAVARRQRFLADASHELRSPLTRIRSELEVDLANRDTADLVATHRSVLDEAVALEQMVADLLYLARSDAGQQTLLSEPVDLDDLVLDAADNLRISSALVVDASGVSGGQVLGDKSQLSRAIRNLADNAAHHADTSVRFTLKESGDGVVLSIADDGPGVSPAQRERVFRRFARTDEGRSRDDGGSGLGLAIVRDVIERHGGTVTVDPGYDAGARFVVSLPLVVGNELIETGADD